MILFDCQYSLKFLIEEHEKKQKKYDYILLFIEIS